MPPPIPASVLAALSGDPRGCPARVEAEELSGGTGAATGGVCRLRGEIETGDGCRRTFRVIAKTVRPLTEGRHAAHAADPQHWAYWRREPLAYGSGVLPSGPGLRAPRCYGVAGSTVFMEDVPACTEDPHVAAARLGQWHASSGIPDLPWLTADQLGQRLAVSVLDWSAVRPDRRAALLWDARAELVGRLSALPRVLSHGDFGSGNLRRHAGDTVVLDWATLGSAPVGADLAYLALDTLTDLTSDYLSGLGGRHPAADALFGYRATLALVGSSRIHWMLAAGHRVPAGYLDFVWDARPTL